MVWNVETRYRQVLATTLAHTLYYTKRRSVDKSTNQFSSPHVLFSHDEKLNPLKIWVWEYDVFS